MNNIKSIFLFFGFFLVTFGIINGQEVSLDIIESTDGCGMATNCSADFICFDILMAVDEDKNLDSYNIWVQYDKNVISRINGGDDSSCVIDNGGDTDIESSAGAYRVAGIPGSPFAMTANNQAKVHTICFSIMNSNAVEGSMLTVGGSMFNGALPTSITFSDGSTDAVEEIKDLELSGSTVSCFILPVELLSFEVNKLESRKLLLEWVTLSEVNNDRFEIQRSFDGTKFETIGFVKGHGTSNTNQSYTYEDNIDKNNRSSNVYYRLKQIDYDGAYDYSEIRSASLSNEGSISVYPNPILKGENLNIGGEYSEAVLFDISGNEIMEFSNKETLSTNTLPKGVYYILFDNTHSEKFIVIQ